MINLKSYKKKVSLNLVFLLILLLTISFTNLSAQNKIHDSLVIKQTEYIQKMLDEGKPAAKLWWNMWLYGYTAGTAVQFAIGLSTDELKTRQDMFLGAGTSAFGAIGQLLMPMVPASAPRKLALIPGDTEAERMERLHMAEQLFKASAYREKEGRSWKMHAISGAINMTSGLVTWLGFKRTFWNGVGNFAINTVITEAQIWTQPTRAIKDYKKYCEMYKNGLSYKPYNQRTHLYVNAHPGGLALRLVF